MRSRLRFLLLLPVATLIACGGASSPPIGTSFNPVAGNYVITAGFGTASAGTFTGSLTVNGSAAAGVFRYNSSSACVPGSQDIAFTGSAAGTTLTLTSAAFAGSVATLSIHLPLATNNVGQQTASGTSVITAGTCALASSSLQAQLMPSYTATWTATLTDPSPATATLSVTELTTANQDGQFPATASVTINYPPCGTSAPDSTYTGLVSGGTLQLTSAQYGVVIVANDAAPPPATVTISGDLYGARLPTPCATVLNGSMTH